MGLQEDYSTVKTAKKQRLVTSATGVFTLHILIMVSV